MSVLVNANMKNSNELDTEIAVKYNYSESISTNAFIVREETLINNSVANGVEYYMVNDGDKVGVSTVVAKIFANENDALCYNKIQEIDEKIAVLEGLNTPYDNISTDSAVDSQIYLNINTLLKAVNNGNFKERDSAAESLVYSINQRQK